MRLEYFQMIDRFVDVNVGERVARAICTVPLQSPVFEGHFPGYPLMPGVLLIECMAQTTGWLVSAPAMQAPIIPPITAPIATAPLLVVPGEPPLLRTSRNNSPCDIAKTWYWRVENERQTVA